MDDPLRICTRRRYGYPAGGFGSETSLSWWEPRAGPPASGLGVPESSRADHITAKALAESISGDFGGPTIRWVRRRVIEDKLLHPSGGIEEALESDADQSDPGPLQPQSGVQLHSRGVDDLTHIRRCIKRAGTGDGGEVGKANLQDDGATQVSLSTYTSGDLLRESQYLAVNHLGIIDIPGEGLLVADALLHSIGHDTALIATPGQIMQSITRCLTERARQGLDRGVREISYGAQTE